MGNQFIIDEYLAFIEKADFPCIGAKTALTKGQLKCMVADHMACPKDDESILQFLGEFLNDYRNSIKLFHSAAVIFKTPVTHSEEMFDGLLWQRLQALANLDAMRYQYDKRVESDPGSAHFSFSLCEEAFFIVG